MPRTAKKEPRDYGQLPAPLWKHFKTYRAVEFIKPLYRSLIMRAANFMLHYRDERTSLPLPSYGTARHPHVHLRRGVRRTHDRR